MLLDGLYSLNALNFTCVCVWGGGGGRWEEGCVRASVRVCVQVGRGSQVCASVDLASSLSAFNDCIKIRYCWLRACSHVQPTLIMLST